MIRIVKMHFNEVDIQDFKNYFEEKKKLIRNAQGCKYLILLQDNKNPSIFFTYSIWEDEKYLNQYRESELFKSTWTIVKKWFKEKPKAWSVNTISELM